MNIDCVVSEARQVYLYITLHTQGNQSALHKNIKIILKIIKVLFKITITISNIDIYILYIDNTYIYIYILPFIVLFWFKRNKTHVLMMMGCT